MGQLQILKHQANGQVHILMVLENVQETCANHHLTENMELTAKGDRGWIYYALDHVVDKEVSYIKLCVKFQTYEIANEFYRVFNQNKPTSTKTNEALKFQQTTTVLSNSSMSTTPVLSSPLVPVTNEAVKDTIPVSISNTPGSKEKTATLTETQFDDLSTKQTFTATSEKKETLVIDDDAKTRSTSSSSAAATLSALASGDSRNKGSTPFEKIGFCTGGSAFTNSKDFKGIFGDGSSIFGSKLAETKPLDRSWNFTFSSALENSPKQTESFPKVSDFTFNSERILNTEPKKKETLVAHDEKEKKWDSLFNSDSKWIFGLPSVTTLSTPVLVENEKKRLMSFGNFEKTVNSSSLSNNSDGSVSIKSNKLESFTQVGAPLSDANVAQTKSEKTFNFSFKNSAEQTESSSLQTPESHSNKNSGEKCVSTAKSTTEPEPMRPRTDEEGLDVLYEEQCELFQFTEWKERGVGKMKILRDPNNSTIQLLMKTDLEHKVCCNQLLSTIHDMKPMTTTNRAWYWDSTDYSDNEPKYDTLCVQFRTVQMVIISCFLIYFENRLPVTLRVYPYIQTSACNKIYVCVL